MASSSAASTSKGVDSRVSNAVAVAFADSTPVVATGTSQEDDGFRDAMDFTPVVVTGTSTSTSPVKSVDHGNALPPAVHCPSTISKRTIPPAEELVTTVSRNIKGSSGSHLMMRSKVAPFITPLFANDATTPSPKTTCRRCEMLRANTKVIRTTFFLTLILGAYFNFCQLSKLKDHKQSPIHTQDENQISTKVDNHGPRARMTSRPMRKDLVKPGDIAYSAGWDASPIVIESHKLVFFTVPKAGCTIWKQLFRRMMGYKDWKYQSVKDDLRQIPHNPRHNGLTYLSKYTVEEANRIMQSPNYTRAIFVREPKERFLSAFLDKALSNEGTHIQSKCCPSGDCVKQAQTFPGFINLVVKGCKNPHWDSQAKRMEPKYWRYIDFVGHVDNAPDDAKRLLKEVGAWRTYGESGWGPNGDKAIFESSSEGAVSHATWAKWQMWQWYTPELERIVENLYAADYANPVLNISRIQHYK